MNELTSYLRLLVMFKLRIKLNKSAKIIAATYCRGSVWPRTLAACPARLLFHIAAHIVFALIKGLA